MLGKVIFYTVLLSSLISINGLQDRRVDEILKLINSQAGDTKSSSEDFSRVDDTNDLGGEINVEDVVKLINLANKNNDPVQEYTNRQKYRGKPYSFNQFSRKPQYASSKNHKETKNRILEQLLEGKALGENYHERLIPNRLLSSNQYKENEVKKESKGGLSEYSKIFVVLDPIALQQSRNTENLPNLLSRILTETSSIVDKSRQDRSKGKRYKGFLLKDAFKSRRYRRESRELGGRADSDEYRPKRSKKEHNSGGSGGRTAIPYVRQRGDIYEREDH